MNTTTKTLLGTLSLLSIIAPSTQARYIQFMSADDFGSDYKAQAKQFIEGLDDLGVPVINGTKSNANECDANNVLGFYSSIHNIMTICTQGVPYWLRFETLVHETVHVIQDARDGLDNDNLEPGTVFYVTGLYNRLSDRKTRLILKHYDKEQWPVEVEAYYFETRPQKVLNELKRWAF
jgi:hypothetical protein